MAIQEVRVCHIPNIIKLIAFYYKMLAVDKRSLSAGAISSIKRGSAC
jgi:hypothetical protein